ncbi:hypothetical protein COOONC_16859 [Cooperia oncophora]
MIVILLLTSGLWDMSVPSHSNQTAGHGFDFDGFKIVTVMVFNSIFNIGAAAALWFHHAPDYPGGYSRAIRGGADSKEGVKKSAEGKKKKKKKSSEAKKKGDKKGSKESQEVSAPGKASGEETEGEKQKTPSKEAIPDAAQQEPKPPSLKKDPNQKDFQYFEPPKPPEEAPNQLEKPRAPGEGAQE